MPWGLICLIFLFVITMSLLSMVDYEWTLYIYKHRIKSLGEFMRRTLFDNDAFGGSDPAIIFSLVCLIGYMLSRTQRRIKWLYTLRPQLGFIFASALVSGLGLVHSFKWVIGRARPNLVVKGQFPFTHWFEFGPQFVSDGIFYGSFPSGHTAAVFMFIVLSYILIGDPDSSQKIKAFGWLWGVMSFCYALIMGIGRCMTLAHWLSDCIGIIFLVWILNHLLYYYILKIPQQIKHIRSNGVYPNLPIYWEFRILWRLFFITLSVMAIIIGIRSVYLQKIPALVLLNVPALFIIYFLGKNTLKLYISSMSAFK